MIVKYAFDGTHETLNDGHSFIALSRFVDGKWLGCDAYIDGMGIIGEVEDWQDGNGAVANGALSEQQARSFGGAILRGDQIDNVTFEAAL